MPKLKTSKTVRKRFKISANGKVSYGKQGRRHLLTDKSGSKKRKLRAGKQIDPTDRDRVVKSLPYG